MEFVQIKSTHNWLLYGCQIHNFDVFLPGDGIDAFLNNIKSRLAGDDEHHAFEAEHT